MAGNGYDIILSRLYAQTHVSPSTVEASPRFQRARKKWKEAREIFEEYAEYVLGGHDSFKYQRVLGWGGFGVATLWKRFDPLGDPIGDVAIKLAVSNSAQLELRREIDWLDKVFRGAEHIVQLVDIESHRQPLIEDLPRFFNSTTTTTPLMVMEAMEKQTLYDLVDRVNIARYYNEHRYRNGIFKNYEYKYGFIPNRVLWRIFLCLARGITAMAYPPPHNHHGQWRETATPLHYHGHDFERIIHFDLDISNVLCGSIDFTGDDFEHAYGPKAKIADFGLAINWQAEWDDKTKQRMLRRGKKRYYAPEQKFPQRVVEDNIFVGHPLNVWAVGLIMFNLMTLCMPEGQGWEARGRYLHHPITGETYTPTWAWCLIEHGPIPALEEFDGYEDDLRNLIALCMADWPMHRPSLDQLIWAIQKGIENSDERALRLREKRGLEPEYDPFSLMPPPDPNVPYVESPPDVEDDYVLRRFYEQHFLHTTYKEDPFADLWDPNQSFDQGDLLPPPLTAEPGS